MAYQLTRRQFVQTALTWGTTLATTPLIMTEAKTERRLVVGEGEYQYEVYHHWPQLPDRYSWQTTHNVAVDRAGNLYVIHEGKFDLKEHPSIFVFDDQGRFVRAFGEQFQGGGHGLEVRGENGEEFLYVCAYQMRKTFAKLTLKGEIVWQQYAPMEAGIYAEGEDTNREAKWGRDRFMPTNFAFLDDGGFLLADGYGSYCIHRYDKDGRWMSCFGGPGDGQGTFNTPHGLTIDRRSAGEPTVVVCDRAHHTLQQLTLDGQHLQTIAGFGLPANLDTWKNLMVVPELYARLTLLNEHFEVVARLGDDTERIKQDNKFTIRRDPNQWLPGKFVHPHDACFAPDGSIYVAEWVGSGRITKLRKL